MGDSIVHKLSKSPLLLELLGSLLTLLNTIEFVKAINDDLAIGFNMLDAVLQNLSWSSYAL